jgi:hypothetical protein
LPAFSGVKNWGMIPMFVSMATIRRGIAASLAFSAPNAGIMASSKGRDMAIPAPLSSVRRDSGRGECGLEKSMGGVP